MTKRLIYITAASAEEAAEIGRMLVEERLAACANLLGPIGSIYWWEGKLQHEEEAALIVKTTEALVERLVERVKQAHSYTCPCIVALPIVGGNQEFLDWIGLETD